MNEHLNKHIHDRIHKPNSKSWMKYYISKDLYDLFTYAIVWEKNREIEFFTLNENYKDIWSILRISEDYGYCKLIDLGYDNNYCCYVVSVICHELLVYLKSIHDYAHPLGEKVWKSKARNCGWSEEEIQYGYLEYKEKCNHWFELYYGKHVCL